ncbi:MAG: hypothetical protein GX427_08550 [Actinomycetales bacterium]|nr:hypothetical protein [Actinomycetales bacterium]
MNETDAATRTMFRTILRHLLIMLAALLAFSVPAGWFVAGRPGMWGALMAVGIAAFFTLTTGALMLATADKPLAIASAAFVGGWLVKVLVLFGVLLAVRGADFYHRGTFFVVLAVAIVASTAIEMRAAAIARIPVVEPGGPA